MEFQLNKIIYSDIAQIIDTLRSKHKYIAEYSIKEYTTKEHNYRHIIFTKGILTIKVYIYADNNEILIVSNQRRKNITSRSKAISIFDPQYKNKIYHFFKLLLNKK